MKLSKLLGVTLFGVLFLPLLFVQAQPPIPKAAVQLSEVTNQWRKNAHNRRDLNERRHAFDGFSALGDEISSTVSNLSSGLVDPDDQIRVTAARGLAKFGPSARNASDQLVKVLRTDMLPEVRVRCAGALGAILSEGSNPSLAKEIVPALVSAMKNDRDTLVRRSACRALGGTGSNANEAAVDLVECMRENEDRELRHIAARSFDDIVSPGCSKAVPVLVKMLKDGIDDPVVAQSVLVGLGTIGEKNDAVVAVLIATLKNQKDIGLRSWAIVAIGKMGPKGKAAVPELLFALSNGLDENPKTRIYFQLNVLNAINEIGPEAQAAIPKLKQLAENPKTEYQLRYRAKQVLRAIDK